MSKQDRQGVRTPADLERKYEFKKRFEENKKAAEDAAKATLELDKSLDAEEVFNRLTDGGKQEGLYRENGKIYLNASYIKAGILMASLISTGILRSKDGTSFYLDLDNGVLRGKFSELSVSGKTVQEIASEIATETSGNAVNGQTQEDIFNKLTNYGAAAGIFYENGQLYVNADYLVAGVIESADGSTFSLDLTNNILKGKFTELYIAGKKATWKENDDGTYTLVGS